MSIDTLADFVAYVESLVDDVHAVTAVSDEPTIGIHVYGGDIGALDRRSYDPDTGAVQWFVSGWDSLPVLTPPC